eukprot:362430-Chlamydomonas_euryale.AAC.3
MHLVRACPLSAGAEEAAARGGHPQSGSPPEHRQPAPRVPEPVGQGEWGLRRPTLRIPQEGAESMRASGANHTTDDAQEQCRRARRP